jgi:hypothetical protein
MTLAQQMLSLGEGPETSARLSLLSLGHMALLDAYLFLLHLMMGEEGDLVRVCVCVCVCVCMSESHVCCVSHPHPCTLNHFPPSTTGLVLDNFFWPLQTIAAVYFVLFALLLMRLMVVTWRSHRGTSSQDW